MPQNLEKNPQTVVVETYGCSLNIADSESLIGFLKENGFFISNNVEEADCVVINSCTVKNTSFLEFKKRINDLKNTGKRIVVTGCIPPIYYDDSLLKDVSFIGTRNLSSISGVVKNTIQGRIVQIIEETDKERLCFPKVRKNPIVEIIPIAQGCLGQCSYCQTRFARGRLKSYSIEAILSRLKIALMEGVKEVWLTAQDTGAYGLDIGTNIVSLLKTILNLNSDFKLRLGMANPHFIKSFIPELIAIFEDERIFKFLHIPAQSGSNKILEEMQRNYTVEDLYKIAEIFRSRHPEISFATDIIVGFPGESEEDFEMSIEFLKRFNPAIVNRSRFSARRKTPASQKKQLHSKIISKRSRLLSKEIECIVSAQNKKWVNWEGEVLIDEQKKSDSFLGRNFAYKPIVIKKTDFLEPINLGAKINVRVLNSTTFHLVAKQI